MKKNEQDPNKALQDKLRIANHLPRMWKINITVAVLAAGGFLIWPAMGSNPALREGWTGGAVTNHHRLIENDCETCHTTAFDAVPDMACASCHEVREHTEPAASIVLEHPELGGRCASCHREHHGEGNLIPVESTLCTECHDRIEKFSPDTEQPRFGNFEQHPEFSVEVWTGDPIELRKVRIGEPGLRAVTQLKFSHARHLTLEDSPLICASCHAFAEHKILPVTFVDHCEQCHELTFDERSDGAKIPHLDADHVYEFVLWETTRLMLEAGGKVSPKKEEIAAESREIEASLFTRGGDCVRCHDVYDVADANELASRFRIEPPTQAHPMGSTVFDHDSHRFTACKDCHQGISDSKSAGDLLLPSINVCRECHADPGTPGKVDSPCLQCHDYHAHQK